MAQPLQSINLVAPAFKGLNTEDSPLQQDPSFAEVADNCVIDERGRIASRKGINRLTSAGATEFGSDRVHRIHYFFDEGGNEEVFLAGNDKIFRASTTTTTYDSLDDVTPAAYTVTANNWKIINFNDSCYFFQLGHEPLKWTNGNTDLVATGLASTYWGNEAVSAYGRLWVANTGADQQTVFWSDLLISDFTTGSSGSIDVSKVWPDGQDNIVGLAAHNGFLLIFGEHSILVYGGADAPSTMALADTVSGVGCVDRNSIQSIGTDVMFLSHSGLRSFGRVIQEKSMPISDLSRTIKRDIIQNINLSTEPVASGYSPENSFYLLTFPDQDTTYCFDLTTRLENGAFRVTRWPSALHKCYARKLDGTFYIGTTTGFGEYDTYQDQLQPYTLSYISPSLTFGDPTRAKILKKLRPTIVGANSAPVVLKWAYDFSTSYKTSTFTAGNQVPAYYNAGAQFGTSPDGQGTTFEESEFTGGRLTTRRPVNTTGYGSVVSIGLESEIDGDALSLQEINVLALIGKIL